MGVIVIRGITKLRLIILVSKIEEFVFVVSGYKLVLEVDG